MTKIPTVRLFVELQRMGINNPKLVDGSHVVDDNFFIVAHYHTPFYDEIPYWILWSKKQPLSSHKRSNTLTLTEDGLFLFSISEPNTKCRNKEIQTFFMI